MRRMWMLVIAACGQPAHGTLPAHDPCALPGGVVLGELDPTAANVLVRRALACTDHEHGRIDDTQYRATVAALDAELAQTRRIAKTPPHKSQPDAANVDWASSVIDVSTQYTNEAWAAKQVLGPPDVYPSAGDNDKAWASLGADDRDEYIEVGYDNPTNVSAVEIYETFNPGAIDQVELIATNGRRIDVAITAPKPGDGRHVFPVRCTRERIASVRVHLDSMHVSGWNEIDAIGVVPCTP